MGERFPTGAVGTALNERKETAFRVTHGDFDDLMLEIAHEFELDLPRSSDSGSWKTCTREA